MVNSSDTLFIEMAVAKGYLDRANADEALNVQRATAEDGADRRLLREVIVEEAWMSAEQVGEVDSEIADGSVRTGKIKGYKLLAKIGQGGMGTVYRVEREETGEIVALKVLPARMAQREDFVERFLREARAAAKMKSEHIVQPIDVGFSGGYYYFAMEYVQGESVDTTLSIDGAITESKALRIAYQMALALRDADHAGMVHRDIKPGNILVTDKGVAKLTDFGLAREIADHSVTQTGVTLGTPNYMSPEQAKAMKSLDARSDIYSLGVTFYHMVTGTVPFKGETSLLTMLKHLNEQPVAPISRRPDLSRGCNDVILKMLKKDRDERYQRPEELIDDLQLVMDGKPPVHAESTEPKAEEEAGHAAGEMPEDIERFAEEIRKQARVRWLRAGVGLFVAALIGVAAWKLFLSEDGTEDTSGGASVSPRKRAPRGGTSKKDGGQMTGSPRQERIARVELDKAKQYAADEPTQLVEIVKQFAAAMEKCRRTSAYAEARQLHEGARQKLTAAVSAGLKSCSDAAERLAGKDRFGEAVAAFDKFPPALRTWQTIQQIDQVKDRFNQRAWARFQELRRKAERCIRSKKLGVARAVIEPARSFGISGITTQANEVLAQIEKEATAAISEQSRKAIEAYRSAVMKVRGHVRRGNFAQARGELAHQSRLITDPAVRDLLATNYPTLAAAKKVWDAVMVGVQRLRRGSKMLIGKEIQTLVKYDPQRRLLIFKAPSKRIRTVSPGWLPPIRLKQLAMSRSGGRVKAIDLAAFFLARGDYLYASNEIRSARADKADAAAVMRYEQQLTMLRRGRLEIEAENLLAMAREQVGSGSGHEEVARTLWELVTSYSGTTHYGRNRAEIERMLETAVREGITVDTLFAVDPTPLPGGRSELKYDFSDRSQERDWLTVWKGSSCGRWSIRPVSGEITAESGLVYFKVPMRGDYSVVVKGRDVQWGSIRFCMPEPSASPRAGLSFNWKRAGAGAVSTLTMPDGSPAETNKLAQFHSIGELELSMEIKRGSVTAKVGGRRLHGRRLKGKDAEDRLGYVVLDGFNLGALITSVTIRCKLDREWLDTEFVRPLRKQELEMARWRMARYQPLLEDNDASAWSLFSPDGAPKGDWTFAKGYAIAARQKTCVMTTGDMNWRDFAFTTRFRAGSTSGHVRVMARWSEASGGAGKGYYVALTAGRGASGSGGKIVLGKAAGRQLQPLKQATVHLIASEWYQVHTEVRGKRVRVIFGGREVLRADDDTYTEGGVGLASFGCGAWFRDVKIKLMR